MDWYANSMYSLELEDVTPVAAALRQFFSYCTSVQRLLMKSFPSEILSEIAPLSGIRTVATSGAADIIQTAVNTFPLVQDLYITDIRMVAPPPSHAFRHRVKRLHLEVFSPPVKLDHFVVWTLGVCADITEELCISCSGSILERFSTPPTPLTLSPVACTNLQSLRLEGYQLNFLAHPNSHLTHIIGRLPSLQHLHMSRCHAFHATAFSALPPTLRSLTLSSYGEWEDGDSRNAFVVALSKCLSEAARVIEMAAIRGMEREDIEGELGDLSPLRRSCNNHNIPFHFNLYPDSMGVKEALEIHILCKSILDTSHPFHLMSSLQFLRL
jgi:hypothetical protein